MSTSPRCQCCHRELPKRIHGLSGRAKRFCSDACRAAQFRHKKAYQAARDNIRHSLASRNEIDAETSIETKGCEAKNGHPYPSGVSCSVSSIKRVTISPRWRRKTLPPCAC